MSKPFRILFVLTPAFEPNGGGVQMSTYKLGRWFAGQGHVVGVFSLEKAGHREQEFATLFAAPERGGVGATANLEELARVLGEFEPDVVVNQMPYDHPIGKVCRDAKPPLLLGCLRNTLFSVKNNLDAYGARVLPKRAAPLFRNRLGRWLLFANHRYRHRRDLEWILRTYDHFVMFGPPNLDELRFFVPDFDPEKIRLIPNSVPRVLDELPSKEKRILWLGRVTNEQKRAELILPLWKRIHRALPEWQLDVVGDGPALETLRHTIRDEGIEGVTLHGRQKPDEYFRRAAIFLMTSSFEGFPNTVVEAQSFGAIPVLFNTFPIADWLVQDGVNGF
ncbi:glycosyltransferase, partial [Marinobacter sp.]|uniref:glycosyltransferase n=1 Tax=Marinobacter sp. TaxID=50741 RepID=UPI00356635E6